MNRHACGNCRQAYDRKHAPRYISECETAYPVSVPKTCVQCGEISTSMEICLACALEHNQCQQCRSEMFGVREDLLCQVRDFRQRFNQSIQKNRAAFAEAISSFKDEVDLFLAQSREAEKLMEADLTALGGDVRAGAKRYQAYLDGIRDLPFAHRSEYRRAEEELRIRLSADREVFAALVEQAVENLSVRQSFVHAVSRAIDSRLPSYRQDVPPPPITTDLSAFAFEQFNEAERLQAEENRRRSFSFGKQLFEQMSTSWPERSGEPAANAGTQS